MKNYTDFIGKSEKKAAILICYVMNLCAVL